MKLFTTLHLSLALIVLSTPAEAVPKIIQSGDVVSLKNDRVRLDFDLSSGSYNIFKKEEAKPVIANASLRVNQWSSDSENIKTYWTRREVSNSLGEGLALDLSFKKKGAPELIFSFTLYASQDFFGLEAGIQNATESIIRVKDIYALADAELYSGYDLSKDFAMIDGFSGGEPLEYGERFYSPLTRANALKSRNNIYLTFVQDSKRHQLTMGGLSYHDFEKFAYITQARKTELRAGADGKDSLLCYLDLPREHLSKYSSGECIELIEGKKRRRWENHEFRCSEMSTSAKGEGKIVIEARELKKGRPYILGLSWWHGLRHGDHADIVQSIFVEFEQNGSIRKVPLIEDRALPRFDGQSKEDVEQAEIPLPPEAIAAGSFRVVVTNKATDQDVYLSEIWLRDGRNAAFLPAELTPVAKSPRPRLSFQGQLFASDPVGKRVDPGQRYVAPDLFYIDVTGSNPFSALEKYARHVRQAQGIELSMYDFPTVCLWYAADKRYGGMTGQESADNTSLGAVEEAQDIVDSGFLKYSRVAVRLVPDSYMPNNHQGWWDDEHWQRKDTDRDNTQNGRYVEPYETTEKWGRAVTERGVIPLTYFQTAYRSEDYVQQFPEHMLFNKRYAWKGKPVDTNSDIFTTWEKTWTRNGRIVWGYDFTDPDFLEHLHDVYNNLRNGGIKGLMFDYPASGWARAGGMEDDDSTTAAAYRTIFRLPHKILGPQSYVHERNMERGTDISLGVVASMRTENDTDSFDGATATRCGLRWYKNRTLVNLDTDSKNLLELADNRDHLRAVLTMCYVTSGRLLLANSFGQFSEENLWDLSRTFPYHKTPKSARPVDAFVSDIPMVYDYEVTPDWHQVTLFNPDKANAKSISVDISGPQVKGALGLSAGKEYYLYDFWNERFIGKRNGETRLRQELRPGEARMISVRACQHRPQIISTNRHIMQGYLDLLKVEWNEEEKTLTGISKVVSDEPYKIILATNGYTPLEIQSKDDEVQAGLVLQENGLLEVTLESPAGIDAEWSVSFTY
ncbi:hypothetical protein DDZ13_03195 [Coraliomargarita sinensis]|uniref:Uncharacterized protein n=1 Tax=Coraliomargarita sinensis TaxID=2174842 RepID=A0A317ZH93_9BACT|nr:hypothetical protein [Coraliomargarita sinensis]PXA04985.1 hypothetical protein DDZ13_03195 [Coraliomargarita sinensis]